MKVCIKESPALIRILLHLLTANLPCTDLKQIFLEASCDPVAFCELYVFTVKMVQNLFPLFSSELFMSFIRYILNTILIASFQLSAFNPPSEEKSLAENCFY